MSVMFNVYLSGSNTASNYVSICNDAIGDVVFLYNYLIKNNIVHKNWFSLEELSITYSVSAGRYVVYRRKPKKELMSLRPTKSFTSMKKAKKPSYIGAFEPAIWLEPLPVRRTYHRDENADPQPVSNPIDETAIRSYEYIDRATYPDANVGNVVRGADIRELYDDLVEAAANIPAVRR